MLRTDRENNLERACAELAAYQAAFDHHSIVVVTDRSGKIIRFNDLFCDISGYSRAELIGRDHRIVNSGHHPRAFWAQAWRTIAHGNVWHGEVCNRRKDGSLYWVDTTIVPLRDADDHIVQYVAIRTVITQRKLAEAQLLAAKNAADAASHAKTEFLANMSHEIRTPLTAILGYVELLGDVAAEGTLPIEAAEYVGTLRRSGQQLLGIVNDVLDMARLEAGKMALEHVNFSPQQLVDEVVSLLRARAEEKSLELRVEALTPLPATFCSDPIRSRQILMNLLANAIKYTDAGTVTLRVQQLPAAEQAAGLEFAITDTGIGISAEEQSRLFRSFDQVETSVTRRHGGSGLGLRISKRLAEMLGGGITVASEPHVGSSFKLFLPALQADQTRLAAPVAVSREHEAAEGPDALHSLASLRILLAEDGEDNRQLIVHHLRKAGAEVTVAENGRQALAALTVGVAIDSPLLEPLPFDLLITDIQMPITDGYTLSRHLRDLGAQLPIIALTANALDGDAGRCLAAGADASLAKPLDRQRLIDLCSLSRTALRLGTEKHLASMQPSASLVTDDRAFLVSELADDPDMADLIPEFLAALPARVATLQDAFADNDLRELGRFAHQLRGAAGGYGYPSISAAAAAVAGLAVTGGDPNELAAELGRLVDRARRACNSASANVRTIATPTTRAAPNARAGTDIARQSVLLIDDAAFTHEIVARNLRDFGVDIVHAYSGMEGLQLAQSDPPDLILLDYDMADMNGLDTIRRLKCDERLESVPVIFITASGDAATEVQAFRNGAVDYLHKPFQPAVLRARVRAALQTQALRELLEREALHDRLTGLPNRVLIQGRIADAVAMKRADASRNYALLFLDFDRFKLLNDTLGHEAGDELLRQIAQRMRSVTRVGDLVASGAPVPITARLGGDEFVVLLEGLEATTDAVVVAGRLLQRLSEEFEVRGTHVVSTASIGIVLGDASYTSAIEVLRDADAAMYEAKAAGRGRCVVFEPTMRARVENRVKLEHDLRAAVERREFMLEYQPIVCLKTGGLEGVEALLRWRHPVRGRVSPADFVPLAEETGLIAPIGEWALHRACVDFLRFRHAMGERAPRTLSVNVSRQQLGTHDFPARVQAILNETGVDPRVLKLEVTENGIMQDPDQAVRVLRELRQLGVGIHVDDFGTGSSSLACLHQFPVDTLKIDRSFVVNSGEKAGLAALLQAVVQMARTLGIGVVAEGIETADQLLLLQSIECEFGQGYLLGRPMPAEAIFAYRRETPPALIMPAFALAAAAG